MKKIIKYIASIGVVALLLVAIIGLNIAIQTNNETTSTSSSEKATRLNVAIVNEDKAVVSGNHTYSLGSSYIKKLEKDNSQNWSVVTRSTASSGDYQLIVVIPSDFSAKILDVNSLSADRARISYEVKAGGNQQIETEATKVGKDIVSDLNNQLVSMYMASILSNLYTAQQNVKQITNQQSGNIYSYRTSLLGSAVGFENNLPTLVTSAGGSLTANESLIQSLSTFSTFYNTLDSSQQSFRTDLMSLIEQRSKDSIDYKEFTSSLLALDTKALSTDVNDIIDSLVKEQKDIQAAIIHMSAPEGTLDENQNPVVSLKEQIEALQEKVNELSEQFKDFENLEKQLKEDGAYKDDTVESLLNQKKDNGGSSNPPSYLKSTAYDYRKNMRSETSKALNKLPAISNEHGDISNLAENMTYLDEHAADSLLSFDTDLAGKYRQELSYEPSGELSLDGMSEARQKLKAAQDAFEDTVTTTQNVKTKSTVTATVSLELPSRKGFVLESWSYNDQTYSETENVEITLSDSSENCFRFTYHYDSNAVDTTDQHSDKVTDTISVKINGVKATSIDLNTYKEKANTYRQAQSTYVTMVQEVKDAYANAQTMLEQYELTDSFLNQSVTELLINVAATAIKNKYDKSFESLQDQIEKLKEKRKDIAKKLEDVNGSNKEVIDSLKSHFEALQNLQKQLSGVQGQETKISSSFTSFDSKLKTLSSTLSGLLSSTNQLKTLSETNATQAHQVNSQLSSFNHAVKNAQNNSSKLATDAQNLMAQFDEELKDSDQFANSFIQVLNNAHRNGSLNEALLDFLSNPVTESSTSAKATVNTYRPFTWILLLGMISLFTAYIFATYNVIQKVKDKFSMNKLQETDVLNTAVITLLAVIIGVILGGVSASKLSVERELIPSWVLVTTLFSLVLTHGQYLLIKNFKALGMGVNLFTLIGFVYLSNTIGTTATLSGLPAKLKQLNALSILEETLLSYFEGQSIGLLLLSGLVLVILVLIAINIFVTLNWQKIFQKQSHSEASL